MFPKPASALAEIYRFPFPPASPFSQKHPPRIQLFGCRKQRVLQTRHGEGDWNVIDWRAVGVNFWPTAEGRRSETLRQMYIRTKGNNKIIRTTESMLSNYVVFRAFSKPRCVKVGQKSSLLSMPNPEAVSASGREEGDEKHFPSPRLLCWTWGAFHSYRLSLLLAYTNAANRNAHRRTFGNRFHQLAATHTHMRLVRPDERAVGVSYRAEWFVNKRALSQARSETRAFYEGKMWENWWKNKTSHQSVRIVRWNITPSGKASVCVSFHRMQYLVSWGWWELFRPFSTGWNISTRWEKFQLVARPIRTND